jgi:hypothetical protein
MSAEADDSSGKLTGQRNENSVLFSLAVLTKDADDRAPNEPIASGSREDSGLIDLKALAAKAESMRPAAMADGGVFAPPIGFAPPLGAPLAGTLGPALGGDIPQRSKLPLFIGAGAGVALLLVLGIVIGVKIAGSDNAAAAGAMPSIPIPTMTSPEPASAAASSEAAPSAAPSASVALSKPKGGAARPQGGAAKPSNGASPGSTGGASTGAATGATAPAAPKKSGGDCGCNGDLMCLMKCSTGH